MNKLVLVTGASGFVGSALVRALASAGMRVRAATRHPDRASFPDGVEAVAVPDFRAPIAWEPLLAEVDAVVHLAGIAHIGRKPDPADYDRVIRAATAGLAHACASKNVRRLVFLSSVRAQSGPSAAHILREVDPPEPTEIYGRAKLAAERAVSACGAPYTILRPALVYGAGAKGNFASLLRLAASPWPLPLASFKNLRSMVSLESLIRAIVFALNPGVATNETYLVADPSPLTLAEIVAALRLGAGRPANLFAVPPTWFATALQLAGPSDIWQRLGGSLMVDPGKLLATGWRPQPDTKEALVQLMHQHRD